MESLMNVASELNNYRKLCHNNVVVTPRRDNRPPASDAILCCAVVLLCYYLFRPSCILRTALGTTVISVTYLSTPELSSLQCPPASLLHIWLGAAGDKKPGKRLRSSSIQRQPQRCHGSLLASSSASIAIVALRRTARLASGNGNVNSVMP